MSINSYLHAIKPAITNLFASLGEYDAMLYQISMIMWGKTA